MFKAGRLSFYCVLLHYFLCLAAGGVRPTLSSGAVKQPSEMPDRFTLLLVTNMQALGELLDRPTLAAAWALKWQPDPQRSTKRKTRQGVVPAWKTKQKKRRGEGHSEVRGSGAEFQKSNTFYVYLKKYLSRVWTQLASVSVPHCTTPPISICQQCNF